MLPSLNNVEVSDVWTGLRPARQDNVRIEVAHLIDSKQIIPVSTNKYFLLFLITLKFHFSV